MFSFYQNFSSKFIPAKRGNYSKSESVTLWSPPISFLYRFLSVSALKKFGDCRDFAEKNCSKIRIMEKIARCDNITSIPRSFRVVYFYKDTKTISSDLKLSIFHLYRVFMWDWNNKSDTCYCWETVNETLFLWLRSFDLVLSLSLYLLCFIVLHYFISIFSVCLCNIDEKHKTKKNDIINVATYLKKNII